VDPLSRFSGENHRVENGRLDSVEHSEIRNTPAEKNAASIV
jgi:hypothetical protein